MLTLFLIGCVQLLWAPSLSLASDAPKNSKVTACRDKANFSYHFDMMKIESQEIRGKISYGMAREQKRARHERLSDELGDCE